MGIPFGALAKAAVWPLLLFGCTAQLEGSKADRAVGTSADVGLAHDTKRLAEAGTLADRGRAGDGARSSDTSQLADVAMRVDRAPTADAGRAGDGSSAADAEPRPDAVSKGDLAPRVDTGASSDAAAPGWYVSTSGDNTSGKSWASAWKELDQIDWSVVRPGDHIWISGGTYRTRLVPTRGGSAAGRITIARSLEPGHDGKVTFDFSATSTPEYWAGYVRIEQPYITIDGGDWNKFEMIADASCLVIVETNADQDYFQLNNVLLRGFANPDNGGTTVCIFSGSMSMDHVWFGKQVGAEDHIKLVTSSHSSLRVENSVFSPWISINGSHSDLIEQCWPGCEAGDLVFKRNLVWDSGPGGGNLVFTLDPHWATVDVSYNVFMDTAGVFQFSSRGPQRISNNVFYNVGGSIGGDGAWEAVNNIFVDPSGTNQNIVWGSTPRYSLWDVKTYGYFSGDGTNLQQDPLFLDPSNILGPDGIPFNADDGFNLRAGSPAINAGTPTIDSADIRGRSLVGKPDIGAYEFP